MHKWFGVILFAEAITLDVDTLIKQNQNTPDKQYWNVVPLY